MDAGGLNASLHIYKVKILLTEPFPASVKYYFVIILVSLQFLKIQT